MGWAELEPCELVQMQFQGFTGGGALIPNTGVCTGASLLHKEEGFSSALLP